MQRPDHDGVSFFVGTEVEHTPAFGHRTLFVVGLQHPIDVLEMAEKNQCTHIYFGANHSFNPRGINDRDTWMPWEDLIRTCVEKYLCTLDLESTQAEGLGDSGLCEYDRFIPMISVRIPYLRLFGYNAWLKIDDKDFAATNPGVWCHSLHDLQSREVFTDWSKYTKDEVIK